MPSPELPRPPLQPKIYHIVHIDRLASMVADGGLLSDSVMSDRAGSGTTIGMPSIKERRLRLALHCHPGLHVAECVPFYFCPRSVMLYLIHRANHEDLEYRGGQEPIVHLEADLHEAVQWAERHGKRWAFTLSNAGANYFEDRCDLERLEDINWAAVAASKWSGPGVSTLIKEGKQAEFLLEERFPWELVERIGVESLGLALKASLAMTGATHRPQIEIRRDWYY